MGPSLARDPHDHLNPMNCIWIDLNKFGSNLDLNEHIEGGLESVWINLRSECNSYVFHCHPLTISNKILKSNIFQICGIKSGMTIYGLGSNFSLFRFRPKHQFFVPDLDLNPIFFRSRSEPGSTQKNLSFWMVGFKLGLLIMFSEFWRLEWSQKPVCSSNEK